MADYCYDAKIYICLWFVFQNQPTQMSTKNDTQNQLFESEERKNEQISFKNLLK